MARRAVLDEDGFDGRVKLDSRVTGQQNGSESNEQKPRPHGSGEALQLTSAVAE
jgi:hypothetical protein